MGKRIGIIGGTGKFGKHLGEQFEEEHEVMVSGKTVENARKVAEERGWDHGSNKKVAGEAEVVIVAVPISVTVEVIHEIGPELGEETLICDITSVKEKPVEAMKEYSSEVLGMHPMYAPTNSIKGQKVVLCPEKGDKWRFMEKFWKDRGADTYLTDPEDHDRAMSIVQGLMHFSEMVVADVIRKSDLSGEEIQDYTSPVYRLITDLTARMLNQKPGLYGSIQSENPRNEDVRKRFLESAEDLRVIVEDREEFEERFEELGEQFDCGEAQERTDEVIEFLSDEIG